MSPKILKLGVCRSRYDKNPKWALSELELRSHSGHKPYPHPMSGSTQEGLNPGEPRSLDLVPSWAVRGRCGLHSPSLDSWKWQRAPRKKAPGWSCLFQGQPQNSNRSLLFWRREGERVGGGKREGEGGREKREREKQAREKGYLKTKRWLKSLSGRKIFKCMNSIYTLDKQDNDVFVL